MQRLFALTLFATACFAGIDVKAPEARKRAPLFELQDATGERVSLESLQGKVVLIDFWATWCGPCKSEMPWLSQLAKDYADQGLVVLGISMDEKRWDAVTPFLEKLKSQGRAPAYPILMGTKRVAYLYGGVEALPLAIFVDRAGRVAAIHEGTSNRQQYEAVIKSLLGQ